MRYGILSRKSYLEDIHHAIATFDDAGVIVSEKHGVGLDCAMVEEMAAENATVLIVDYNALSNPEQLPVAARRILIKHHGAVRIIIIATGEQPGNVVMSKLVKYQVYDIITPNFDETPDDAIVLPHLLQTFGSPGTYRSASKWDIENEESLNKEKGASPEESKTKTIRERQIVEKQTTVLKDRIIGTVVIAVGSNRRGDGTSHTACSIAFWLSKIKGMKTALVELNRSKDFASFAEILPGNGIDECKMDDLNIYASSNANRLSDILDQGYTYVVLDLGQLTDPSAKTTEVSPYIDEMYRADKSILVTGCREWHIPTLRNLLKGNIKAQGWNIVINHSNKRQFGAMKDTLIDFKCFQAPYSPDMFEITNEMDIFFENLLTDIIPSERKTRRKFFGLG